MRRVLILLTVLLLLNGCGKYHRVIVLCDLCHYYGPMDVLEGFEVHGAKCLICKEGRYIKLAHENEEELEK